MHPLFLTLALACALTCAQAQQRLGVPPAGWGDRERTELAASVIVRGRVGMADPESLTRALQRGGGYVQLEVQIHETLKGDVRPALNVMFFAAPPGHPHGYRPNGEQLRLHLGAERILLLQQVGDRLFLADRFRGAAILEATEAEVTGTRTIVARHREFAELVPGADVPFAAEVASVLDELAGDPAQQRSGFAQLQELGTAAVPAMIRHLDDARRITALDVTLLREPAGPNDRLTIIRPRQFRDALMAIVQNLTGENFGFDADRVDQGGRAQVAAKMHVYAQYAIAEVAESRHTTVTSREQR